MNWVDAARFYLSLFGWWAHLSPSKRKTTLKTLMIIWRDQLRSPDQRQRFISRFGRFFKTSYITTIHTSSFQAFQNCHVKLKLSCYFSFCSSWRPLSSRNVPSPRTYTQSWRTKSRSIFASEQHLSYQLLVRGLSVPGIWTQICLPMRL